MSKFKIKIKSILKFTNVIINVGISTINVAKYKLRIYFAMIKPSFTPFASRNSIFFVILSIVKVTFANSSAYNKNIITIPSVLKIDPYPLVVPSSALKKYVAILNITAKMLMKIAFLSKILFKSSLIKSMTMFPPL